MRGALHSFIYDLQDYNVHIQNIKQKIIPKILKDFIIFRTHVFNCMLRRVEGYFINQSLLQMKTTLTQYLVYSMSRKYGSMSNGPQVLFYEGFGIDGCASNSFKYQPFSFFNYNTPVTKDTLITNQSEIIMKLIFSSSNVNGIQGFGLDVDNSKLLVFTVINTNDNENHPSTIDDLTTISKGTSDNTIKKISNNPPNPPYINTIVLKKFFNESKYIEMIQDYLGSFTILPPEAKQEIDDVKKKYEDRYNAMNAEFMTRINQYSFYLNDRTFQALIANGVMNVNAYTHEFYEHTKSKWHETYLCNRSNDTSS